MERIAAAAFHRDIMSIFTYPDVKIWFDELIQPFGIDNSLFVGMLENLADYILRVVRKLTHFLFVDHQDNFLLFVKTYILVHKFLLLIHMGKHRENIQKIISFFLPLPLS